MLDPGGRDDAHPVAGQPEPKRDVHVLAVHEVAVVEAARTLYTSRRTIRAAPDAKLTSTGAAGAAAIGSPRCPAQPKPRK